jgi:hypothetical protein
MKHIKKYSKFIKLNEDNDIDIKVTYDDENSKHTCEYRNRKPYEGSIYYGHGVLIYYRKGNSVYSITKDENGNKYECEYQNNLPYNGKYYESLFNKLTTYKNGHVELEIKFTKDDNGNDYTCEYRLGEPYDGQEFYKNTDEIATYENGKLINKEKISFKPKF